MLGFAAQRVAGGVQWPLVTLMVAILAVPLFSVLSVSAPAIAATAGVLGLWLAGGLPNVVLLAGLTGAAGLASTAAVERRARERRVRAQIATLEQRSEHLAVANASQQEASEVAEAVLAVTRDAPASLEAAEVAARVARNVCGATRSVASAVLLWDGERQVFRIAAVAGAGAGPEVQQLEIGTSAAAVLQGTLDHDIADIPRAALSDPVLEALMRRWKAAGLVVARLQHGDRRLGAVLAARRAAAPMSAKERRILSGIALQAAAALESAILVNDLRTANQLREEFTATMSHELRTPLNVILGYNDLQREGAFGELSAEHLETLDRVHDQALQLLELIQATLDVGRLERGLMTVDLREVSLHDLIQQLRDSVPPAWRKPDVELHWRVDPAVTTIRSDPVKLQVMLRNLVHNALKFTHAGQVSVTVTADRNEDRVHFVVQDSGVGIAAQDLTVIFEMFRQASNRDASVGGVGLGLYIVKRMVGLLGGEIDVRSAPGRGATFRIHLPTAGPHAASQWASLPAVARPLRAAG